MLSTYSIRPVLTVYGLYLEFVMETLQRMKSTQKEAQACEKADERLSLLCRLKVKKSNDFV